mmetsp:Transcript_79471/g.143418  ORF Transcript_79471/g.143418 Transcript_79471/m.143418 type:complete len:203 (+) Transcript_79471:108-716(+)
MWDSKLGTPRHKECSSQVKSYHQTKHADEAMRGDERTLWSPIPALLITSLQLVTRRVFSRVKESLPSPGMSLKAFLGFCCGREAFGLCCDRGVEAPLRLRFLSLRPLERPTRPTLRPIFKSSICRLMAHMSLDCAGPFILASPSKNSPASILPSPVSNKLKSFWQSAGAKSRSIHFLLMAASLKPCSNSSQVRIPSPSTSSK